MAELTPEIYNSIIDIVDHWTPHSWNCLRSAHEEDPALPDDCSCGNESLHRDAIKAVVQAAEARGRAEADAKSKVTGDTSDGYHTFNELYEFRMLYNAALFNEWAKQKDDIYPGSAKHRVHKSWKHADGEDCFGGGWFIVMAELPTGQISNHYEAKDWDLFQIPEYPKAATFDGHTSADVATRLRRYYGADGGES